MKRFTTLMLGTALAAALSFAAQADKPATAKPADSGTSTTTTKKHTKKHRKNAKKNGAADASANSTSAPASNTPAKK